MLLFPRVGHPNFLCPLRAGSSVVNIIERRADIDVDNFALEVTVVAVGGLFVSLVYLAGGLLDVLCQLSDVIVVQMRGLLLRLRPKAEGLFVSEQPGLLAVPPFIGTDAIQVELSSGVLFKRSLHKSNQVRRRLWTRQFSSVL